MQYNGNPISLSLYHTVNTAEIQKQSSKKTQKPWHTQAGRCSKWSAALEIIPKDNEVSIYDHD